MPSSTSAAHSSVNSSATSVALFTATSNQVAMRTVYNDSTAKLYLKYGVGASTTSHAVQIVAGGYFEFPQSGSGVYNGVVEGVWASANGAARCVEMS